jgi:hypothetical protein
LKSTTGRNSVVINSENIVLECVGYIIDVNGTHLAFVSNSRVTFQSASSSNLTFSHDAAEVFFADCTWINSLGARANWGLMANVNSSSIVNFYQCEIAFQKRHNEEHGGGGGVGGGVVTKSTLSLSLRSNYGLKYEKTMIALLFVSEKS